MSLAKAMPHSPPRVGRPGEETGGVILVGIPNVGKSALFNRLTGCRVTVSNYPGTTVEVFRGTSRLLGGAEVADTPGLYSLTPISEEERVARDMLRQARPRAVVHIVDAKGLDRMLGMTLQLIEAGLPVVLALNMSDEADRLGIRVDRDKLQELLGVPVVRTVATRGAGLEELAECIRLADHLPRGKMVDYGPVLEPAIEAIARRLPASGAFSARARAVLLLHGDAGERDRLRQEDPSALEEVSRIVWDACMKLQHTAHYHTAMSVKERADDIVRQTVVWPRQSRGGWTERLSQLMMSPLWGLPILALVLWAGLYQFVGVFGAGTAVDFLDETVFARGIVPGVVRFCEWAIPWAPARDLIAGDYGLLMLGLRYAVAIVLPIVGTFFLAFSLLEDSGYLPRLAMLIDRVFKKIGLSGRAVIPMVLGFGCVTMATLVTRTLPTRRERLIATFLLALAVPCSAQMGVILGLLAGHPAALAVWAGVVAVIFLLAGGLAGRLLPGPRPSFYMELPPLRLPRPWTVLTKTAGRMGWYFKEILPLFLLASLLIWLGKVSGIFALFVSAMGPVMRALGLPDQTAGVFLFGFFRRDFGVAWLYDLHRDGMIQGNQLVVAAVTLTLFLPCVAQFLVMRKERGLRTTLALSACVAVLALGVGMLLHAVLEGLGVRL